MKTDAAELLQALVDHELAMKSLYLTCAGAFGDFREFWQTLAGDEQSHADRLEGLLGEPAVEKWLSQEARLRPQAVSSSIGHIQDQQGRITSDNLSLLQALAIAKDVEDALIDRLSILPQTGRWEEIDAVISELRVETEEHRRRIAEALDVERRMRL